MTVNILEDLQFAMKLPNFPSWSNNRLIYGDWGPWTDVESTIKFSGPVKFRVKPGSEWSVSSKKGINLTTRDFKNKDTMMSYIWQEINAGNNVTITTRYSERTFADIISQNIQYKQEKSSEWVSLPASSRELSFSGTVSFRIRPDHYHLVDSADPVNKGSVQFHDIDELCKYVDNRIRTNGLDFKVIKVKY